MKDVVAVSTKTTDLLANAADRILFQIGEVAERPKTDPSTPDDAQSVAITARFDANSTALGDDRVYTALRESAVISAWGRATRRRLQSRLVMIAAARSRALSKAQMLKTSITEGLADD